VAIVLMLESAKNRVWYQNCGKKRKQKRRESSDANFTAGIYKPMGSQ
jgi:hypothetical protein